LIKVYIFKYLLVGKGLERGRIGCLLALVKTGRGRVEN